MGVIINVVCGLNAVGMRRNGISAAARADVKKAYKLFYRSGLNVEQALEAGKSIPWSEEADRFMKFVSHRTKRGLCSARSRHAELADASE